MAMAYHRVFKVPTWIIINDMTKARTKAVMAWLNDAEAYQVEWPGKTFPKALFEYRNKGYAHALPDYPFVLDTSLLVRAAAEHLKNAVGPTSYLAGSVNLPPNRLNRHTKNDADLVDIFNDLLSLEDPIALSQVFQVQELCYRDDAKRHRTWVSIGPGVPKNLLTRIADRVITIGDEAANDLSVGGLEKDELNQKLNDFFAQP